MNTELKSFRKHQTEADDAIYEELRTANKCIVKMFCGTGKSLLMRKCKSAQNQQLVVYVFPSLSLIDQFCTDYFTNVGFASPFKISSENNSTTDPALIQSEIQRGSNKIICVTYQSYNTLLENLGSTKIDVCIYDEAHHAVGETYQKLIFEQEESAVKQIFFTATPKNANGIVMYDRDILDAGMCGKLVYDYSYLQGVNDADENGKHILNKFEIRVDMYTENTKESVYESIARAILVSGNNRVLTFHAEVSAESKREYSVLKFAKEGKSEEFEDAFTKVLTNEFPEKAGLYTKFKMIALGADKPVKCNVCSVACKEKKYVVSGEECCRYNILNKFDTTLDNEVYIISSCETIGEGIDTKNANMCVFVDPKSSFVKIIQNIGRIVRPQSKPSTVLIPCWVDKTKYVGCDDREKCDEVIRSDLNKDGNFNGILNVLSALRQADEDLYDICLHYPDTYSPQEIRSNLEKHGYKVLDPVGDGELVKTMEYLLDTDIDYDDYEDCETNEEMIIRIAEDNDVCVEIHTNSFENQIEKYNSECESGEVIRLYKEEDDEGEGNQVYCPIVKKCGKRKGDGSIKELNRKDRIKIDVHTNPDVKVLWKLVGDFTKEICSCVLECEVMCYDDRWFEQFEKLKKFIDENEIRPNKESRNPDEKQSGRFMTNTIRNYKYNKDGMKKEDRRCVWEQFCKDYNKYMLSDDDIWFAKLSELIAYFDDNKKRPSEHSTKIGKWLRHQIENYNSNMMPENRIEKWEQFWNAHSKYFIGLQDKWFEKFNQYEQYIKQHQTLPLASKSLGRWGKDNDKLVNNIKMNNDRFNKWNELKQKYSKLFQDIWFENLIELSLFIKTYNKLPVYSSTKTEKEKIIAQWNNKQIYDYKNKTQGMKDKIKYEKWTEHILLNNELYLTLEDKWLIKYEKTSEYMKNEKKRPSAKDLDENIKDMGSWLTNNLLKLTKKNKGFNSDNEKCKFIDLILNYPDLFHKYIDTAKQIKLEVSIVETSEEIVITPKPKKSMKLKEPKTKEFQETPELWYQYHAISEENEKSFPEESIPRNRIIQEMTEIKGKRTRSVVDMGCGKAQIADHFTNDSRFTFINYDHMSSKENVLVQDISNTGLEDDSVEICILCLAMWGSNCHDYVREAYRILESGGKLYIMEATKRWTSEATTSEATTSEATESEFLTEGGAPADKLKVLLENSGFQIAKSSIEKFCLFVCTKM